MKHILEMTEDGIAYLQEYVFKPIARGNAILFLGSGASVGEKKYLSKQIIEYYSAKIGIQFETEDIVEFVDTIIADTRFERSDFDNFTIDLLGRLNVTEMHSVLARIHWREIITTNCDLIIERAYDKLFGEGNANFRLKIIKNRNEYNYRPANDEVKYVKLNGCISDPQKYPLVFSSEDFKNANRFYKEVLKSLENLSPKIVLISIGYSFLDPFAKSLLKKFDSFNFRSRKWIINVDPYAQDSQLAYFSDNKIAVVRLSIEEFISKYSEWEKGNNEVEAERFKIKFLNREDQVISVPTHLKIRLNGVLTQLSRSNIFQTIDAHNFYLGEEPTYDTIKRNYDVIRRQIINKTINILKNIFVQKQDLIPIVALQGSYGTGKTTLAYRLVEELSHEEELDLLAFEVIDPDKLQVADLIELSKLTKATQILLVFNRIERDSIFKSLIDLRARISAEQIDDIAVVMMGSIRENILERYKQQHQYANLIDINVDSSLDELEALDLVQKLNDVGLVRYRDAREKRSLANKIIQQYTGDTFTTLVALLSNSDHFKYLLSAYNQLPDKAKNAFLYTSLLYRYGCKMPASLLRRLVSVDWEAFLQDVIQIDCKGILIQESNSSSGTDPDLYFRTKHPIISDLLVKYFYPDNDKRYAEYLKLVRHLIMSYSNAILLVDLLKSIRNTEDLSQDKIDKLYDACSQEFGENPHFIIHYAINLQHRNSEDSIRNALSKIIYVEGILERRNHRLIHRRAALNFELAKIYYSKETELIETIKYIKESRELFDIKLRMDPFSSFSYIDFLKFEIWYLDKIMLNEEDKVTQMIKIEDLFDQAEQSVFDDLESIVNLKSNYLRTHKQLTLVDKNAYLQYLQSIYDNEKLRHLALILLYYFYREEKNETKCNDIITKLETYAHFDAVAKILFSYYGSNLHLLEKRKKLLRIVRENTKIAEINPVNFHFYSYIAAAYNRYFEESLYHVNELRTICPSRSPVYRDSWRDHETSEIVVFSGIIERVAGGRLRVRVVELQQIFGFQTTSYIYPILKEGTTVNLRLHFYLSGIRAEIVSISQVKTNNI